MTETPGPAAEGGQAVADITGLHREFPAWAIWLPRHDNGWTALRPASARAPEPGLPMVWAQAATVAKLAERMRSVDAQLASSDQRPPDHPASLRAAYSHSEHPGPLRFRSSLKSQSGWNAGVSVGEVQTTQQSGEKHQSRIVKFFTSIPGFMTGLATVVTATAAITTALVHSSPSRAQQSPPAAPSGTQADTNTGGTAATGTATSALVITNSGTDIHSSSSDIHDDGTDLWPDNNGQLAVWTGSSLPTPQQCLYLIRTQGAGVNVAAPARSIICAQASENTLAIIQVQSIDISLNYPMTTLTTIYAITPGS